MDEIANHIAHPIPPKTAPKPSEPQHSEPEGTLGDNIAFTKEMGELSSEAGFDREGFKGFLKTNFPDCSKLTDLNMIQRRELKSSLIDLIVKISNEEMF